MLNINTVYCGDCLELMQQIDNKSIDMICCDLPYGTTDCKWDIIIPFDKLWGQYKRIIKENGAIVLTASQPFTSALVMSNPNMFRHGWIYKKRCASNFAQAKYSPMKEHEDILVFGISKVNYYPQKETRHGSGVERVKHKFNETRSGEFTSIRGALPNPEELRYPSSVQEFNNRAVGDRGDHPNQKPVALMEYLIKTYTQEGDLVLDNCAGSFTTAVACDNLKRNWICIEKEEKYCEVGLRRIEENKKRLLDNITLDF
jgi:site-specific DNA-methyltransferase (adenine-specific)